MPEHYVVPTLSVFSRISRKLLAPAMLLVLWTQPGRSAQNDPRLHDGEADLVLLEGKLITVDPNDSIAEAIAVKGRRIIAVGHTDEIGKLIGHQTQVLHLGGRGVLPGLVDADTRLEGIAIRQWRDRVRGSLQPSRAAREMGRRSTLHAGGAQ